MSSRQFGVSTMVMLAALRVVIGWHFFHEGLGHYVDRDWSSEGFLRQARGPLAPAYHAVLPDYLRWEEIMHSGLQDNRPQDTWKNAVRDAWQEYRSRFSAFYGLTEEQKKQADAILKQMVGRFDQWVIETEPDIENHLHQWRRLEESKRQPGAADIPYQKQRLAERQAMLNAETRRWMDEVRAMERDLQKFFSGLLDESQHARGSLSQQSESLVGIDLAMKYGIMAIGGCLLIGLFTRTACFLGALFLASVVLSQPFWVADTQLTYNQFVEMFALLALGTTAVGRWGGLDYFIHNWIVRPLRGERHE